MRVVRSHLGIDGSARAMLEERMPNIGPASAPEANPGKVVWRDYLAGDRRVLRLRSLSSLRDKSRYGSRHFRSSEDARDCSGVQAYVRRAPVASGASCRFARCGAAGPRRGLSLAIRLRLAGTFAWSSLRFTAGRDLMPGACIEGPGRVRSGPLAFRPEANVPPAILRGRPLGMATRAAPGTGTAWFPGTCPSRRLKTYGSGSGRDRASWSCP